MSVRDLIPWGRTAGSRAAAPYRDADPFMALHREVNRLFDDVFRGVDLPGFGRAAGWLASPLAGWSASWPNVEISETDKEIRVTAEVPGMEEKDIDVTLDDGVLTVRGEKRSESEDKDRQFSERFYGRFERRIPVGVEVQEDRVAANFKNGVLTVTLPKTERSQSKAKRIAINGR